MSMLASDLDLRASRPSDMEADVLVIGSGAGGSTVAATAVELGLSVLILEEGPYVPAAKAPARMADSFATLWRHGGLTAAYGSPPLSYAEGRCVGGTTEINGAIFQRAPESLLDEWGIDYRIQEFSAQGLAQYYDWAAGIVNASPTPGAPGMPTEKLAQAGAAMGWQTKPLERMQRSCVGTNMCALACPTGGKQSMTATLIPQVMTKGARVISDAKVTKILKQGTRVKGVEAVLKSADGQKQKIIARARKVFLCAGAIQTPVILQNTGYGKNAGRSLRLHPMLKCLSFFSDTIDAQNYRVPLVAITEFMPKMRMGGSLFTPATFGLSLAEDWNRRASYAGHMRNAAIYYSMVRAQGRGRIYAMPGGLSPIVTYKLDKQDWENMRLCVARLGQALLKAGAKHVLPSIAGHDGWTAPEAATGLVEQSVPVKKAQLMAIHLFGSCPIGEDESRCAANSFGRVFGAENLYLADASVIPEAPGVNPQATVMALARRNALYNLGG